MFVQKPVQVNNSICGKGNDDLGWSKYFRFNYLTTVLLHNILKTISVQFIIVTSQWAARRLKSPAYRVFPQPFVQAHIIENIKAPRHWFPLQRASKSENASIWWRHHLDMHWQWVRQELDDKQWDILWFSIKGTEVYYLLIGPRSVTRFNKISSADLNDVIWSIKAVLNHVWPQEPARGLQWWPKNAVAMMNKSGAPCTKNRHLKGRAISAGTLKNTHLTRLDAYQFYKQICFGVKCLKIVFFSILQVV